ncbi:hypothetical protein DFP72DRAFT_923090 [Ephemerocybe angulata]|uniref:Uncharacterized protein n=1 Tax=Ephemerocybe angulata TaxID=980116 RepID=A0A8H6HI85_9AGAR|nr:hypothetical protein DFP72DRAFT_923090 [Tulosesus angulatus]
MDSPGQSSEKSKPAFPHNQLVPSSISPASPQESTSLSLSYIDKDDIPGLAQFDDVVTPLAATAEVPDPDRLGEITSTTSESLKSAKSASKSVPTAPSILPNSGTLLQRSRSGKRFLLSIFPLSILPISKDTLTNHGSTTEALAAPMDTHTHTHDMPTETSSQMAALHELSEKEYVVKRFTHIVDKYDDAYDQYWEKTQELQILNTKLEGYVEAMSRLGTRKASPLAKHCMAGVARTAQGQLPTLAVREIRGPVTFN